MSLYELSITTSVVAGIAFGLLILTGFLIGVPRMTGTHDVIFVFRRLKSNQPLCKVLKGSDGGGFFWQPFVLEKTQYWWGSAETSFQGAFDIGEVQVTFTIFGTVTAPKIPFEYVNQHGSSWLTTVMDQGIWYFNLRERLESLKSIDQLNDRILISKFIQQSVKQANRTRLERYDLKVEVSRWESTTTYHGEVGNTGVAIEEEADDTPDQQAVN